MNTDRIEAIAYRTPWMDRIEVILKHVMGHRHSASLGVAYALPITYVERKPEDDGTHVLPAFSLDQTAAQQLMDMLWNCGIRPTEGSGSAGALAATQHHLKDMQTLTFKLLEQVNT